MADFAFRSKPAKFQVMVDGKIRKAKVRDPDRTFDKASQEDVARHVLGRDSKGKGSYLSHGKMTLLTDGEGGEHSGYIDHEGKRSRFNIVED